MVIMVAILDKMQSHFKEERYVVIAEKYVKTKLKSFYYHKRSNKAIKQAAARVDNMKYHLHTKPAGPQATKNYHDISCQTDILNRSVST